MGKMKIFIVGVIVFFTMLSIVYLAYISKQIEKYAVSRNDGRTCVITYSSSGGRFSDSQSIEPALMQLGTSINKTGYDIVNLGIKNNIDQAELAKQLLKHMGYNKKYILIDINTTELVTSKNTILIKISSSVSKYRDNMEYANRIKDVLALSGVKVNIITEGKQSFNQDLGYRSIRIEIPRQMNVNDGKKLIESILEGLEK